eukprot:6177152-Pleurochrysis_carterae.AAC.2
MEVKDFGKMQATAGVIQVDLKRSAESKVQQERAVVCCLLMESDGCCSRAASRAIILATRSFRSDLRMRIDVR